MQMSVKINNQEYLSTKEALAFLGVTEPTLRSYRHKYNLVPMSTGVGRKRYYSREALEKIQEYRPVEDEHQQE